jgi:hypothetical protein
MKWHDREKESPPLNLFVLCYYSGGNWRHSKDDPNYVVAMATTQGADEVNNLGAPYRWQTFGALSMFARDVSHWADIPRLVDSAPPAQGAAK